MYLHKQSFSSGQCDGPGSAAGAPHAQGLASPTVLGANSIAAAEPPPIVSDRRTHHDIIGSLKKNDGGKMTMENDGWRTTRANKRTTHNLFLSDVAANDVAAMTTRDATATHPEIWIYDRAPWRAGPASPPSKPIFFVVSAVSRIADAPTELSIAKARL